jgi:hypothetical protein
MQSFPNELAYFATTLSYASKMFMKSTPGVHFRVRNTADESGTSDLTRKTVWLPEAAICPTFSLSLLLRLN